MATPHGPSQEPNSSRNNQHQRYALSVCSAVSHFNNLYDVKHPANNDSESDVGAQEELVAEKYMRAPADASLADKGRAKGKKATKRAGATALQGFRKYWSPSDIPVSTTTSLTSLPPHHCLSLSLTCWNTGATYQQHVLAGRAPESMEALL